MLKLKTFFYIFIIAIFLYPQGYFVLNEKENHSAHLIKDSAKSVDGLGIYLINLDHSKARYDHVRPQIEKMKMSFQRIPAVNGMNLSESDLLAAVDFAKYKDFLGDVPKKGTIGCSLSHIKTWQNFLDSNYKYALILEDDVGFDSQELLKVLDFLIINDNLWDINSFELSHRGTPLTIKSYDKYNLSIYLTEISHSGAYLINRRAAIELLKTALPIKMPIDHYFTRSWEMGLKFTGIEPRIVLQTLGDSEIRTSSSQYEFNKNTSLIIHLNKALYKLQSYIARFIYNLKIYIELKLSLHR